MNTIAPNQDKSTTSKNPGLISMMVLIGLLLCAPNLYAQTTAEKLTLDKVIELALQNNNLLKIKQLQLDEKQQKVNEDKVKLFPVIMAGGGYQHDSGCRRRALKKVRWGSFRSGRFRSTFR